MALSPLLYETSSGNDTVSRAFSPSELNYPSIVVTVAKFDVSETWYRAGWIAIFAFIGNVVPSATLIQTTPLGINEPRLIVLPENELNAQIQFKFSPVFWLGEYIISIEGLIP